MAQSTGDCGNVTKRKIRKPSDGAARHRDAADLSERLGYVRKRRRSADMTIKRREFSNSASVAGQCLCGAVKFEIHYPAFWAWHDHTAATRRAHGAAYATYIGTWRKRFRITAGEDAIARYEDPQTDAARSF